MSRRTPDKRARAISTVMDVSLALLLISASVVLIATSMNEDSEATTPDPVAADQTAETLAATSMSVEYSIEPVTDHSEWDGENVATDFADESFRRVSQGSAAGLLAEAAVANVEVDGTRLTKEGQNFEPAVEAKVLNTFLGANQSVYVEAVWRPYPESAIEGIASAGDRPPRDTSVNTAVLRVTSDVPSVGSGAVERGYRLDGFEGAAGPIAAAVVRGLYPPTEMQLLLERQGFHRALGKYRYQRMATTIEASDAATDDFSFENAQGVYFGEATVISRNGADARAANAQLTDHLTQIIAADMDEKYDDDVTADELGSDVATGEVEIIVKTW
ncbi:DUF7284 family protein [Halorientalis persicus]|nr:hypothetical protein [Halorientalis persicus]